MSPQAPYVARSLSPESQSAKRSLEEEDSNQGDQEQQQAPKRRRTSPTPKPRTTEFLNLELAQAEALQSEQVARLMKILRTKQKIVVVAGAGISVSAGSTRPSHTSPMQYLPC
jgi:16S rRNA G1207 methylase RsmC